MTTVDSAAARSSYHLIKYDDTWLTARPLPSAPGVRKLSDAEAAPLRKQWEDRLELSAQAQAAQTEQMKVSEEQNRKNGQIKFLMDQLHREVTRLAKGMPEDTAFATIADDSGKVIGKIYQSGSLWFDSDAAGRVGGSANLQRISEQAWAQTKDPKQARQAMVDQISTLLNGSSQVSVTLTGLAENPQPAFKADAPLLAIMDRISAIDPEFGSRFDDWRPEGKGGSLPQAMLSVAPAPATSATILQGASRILTMSVDIEALKERAARTTALYEKQEALRLHDPTADAAGFSAQMRAKMEKAFEAAKRLITAMDGVPAYAVIRDRQGKEVGRINQDGGFVTTDPRFHGLHSAVVDGQRSIVNGKHDRYEAIRKALGSSGRIELTGVDVDPQTLFPDLRKAAQDARDALYALTEGSRTKVWA